MGNLLRDKYYVDEFYALGVVRPLQGVANLLWRKVDQNVIDGMVNGTAAVVEVNGELTRRVQSGQIGHYAFFILTGSVVLIAMYLVL